LREKHTLFSLFSGAGGLDLGFELTGKFHIEFANDITSPATETYASNFKSKLVTDPPNRADLPAVFQGDVTQVKFNGLDDLHPDVVSGGPPCQDFSVVRGPQAERSGMSVLRGRLYAHFVRALIHLQPKVFMFENVPGLISANEGKAYEVIKGDFAGLDVRWDEVRDLIGNSSAVLPKGYELMYSGQVDASRLGVPQARRRIIIIGLRKDLAQNVWWKIEVLKKKITLVLEGGKRLVCKYPLTPIEALEGRPLPELDERYKELMREYDGVVNEVGTEKAFKWKSKVRDRLSLDVIKDYLMLNGIYSDDEAELNRAFSEHTELLKELKYLSTPVSELNCPDGSNKIPRESPEILARMREIPPDENHEFVRGTKWEVEGRGISLIYRRVHPLKPAYTIVAYGGGGTWSYHYERNRAVLTNRERARLQTFPDDFAFKGTRSEVRAQIGEAVPPLMAKRIAETIAEILDDVS
jgi:DNA (cytosine-5)-methyltransferase 1